MQCPYCSACETTVLDTRDAEDQTTVRRRRSCEKCGKRFTTYERVEGVDLTVVKKDGQREPFSREKLKRGVVKATWKRPVTITQIEDLLNEVERKLRQKSTTEVKSWEIGNLVINRLKKIDPLSYLLFASVYRDFDTLEEFQSEIARLAENEKNEEGVV